jgi:trimethylamine---corrinoid protein Co-methyltransferase
MSISLRPVLERPEIDRIHELSLDLLERVGVDYRTRRAAAVLEPLGCRVAPDGSRVRLPREAVAWALEQAPRVVRLCARDPSRDVVLDGQRPHHTTDSQGTKAIDCETGERRAATADDLRRALLFADALDQIEIVNISVAAGDVPAHERTLRHFALAFAQTSKHVRSGVLRAAEVPFLIEMARAACGAEAFRPVFSAVDCTISPLTHDGPMTEACIELARLGVPIMVYPMPLAGGTAPVTAAGTVLLHNVEFLSGLVLFQAVNPGTPIIYGTGASQLDMQTGRLGHSADGHAMRLGLCDLARFYNLPVNLWGTSTSSEALDALYGHEATTYALLAHLAGVDEIYSMGLLGDAQVLSLDKMVLDNHLAWQIGALVRPLAVDEEHLQAEVIERVGIAGHFLGEPETRALTRKEYLPAWPPAGASLLDLVHQETMDILHHHRPPPLPDGAPDRIEAILAEAGPALGSE